MWTVLLVTKFLRFECSTVTTRCPCKMLQDLHIQCDPYVSRENKIIALTKVTIAFFVIWYSPDFRKFGLFLSAFKELIRVVNIEYNISNNIFIMRYSPLLIAN